MGGPFYTLSYTLTTPYSLQFGIGLTEFLIAGILPQIAAEFSVSIPKAGMMATSYALRVFIGPCVDNAGDASAYPSTLKAVFCRTCMRRQRLTVRHYGGDAPQFVGTFRGAFDDRRTLLEVVHTERRRKSRRA